MVLSLRHYDQATLAHAHDQVQLVFGLRGELHFEMEGRGSRIDVQRLAVVPARRHHACESPLSVARFLCAAGLTPMEFIRQRRLQRGRELLESTELPVGEIANRVGYDSQSAFTAALVRAFERTPRPLRREPCDKRPD